MSNHQNSFAQVKLGRGLAASQIFAPAPAGSTAARAGPPSCRGSTSRCRPRRARSAAGRSGRCSGRSAVTAGVTPPSGTTAPASANDFRRGVRSPSSSGVSATVHRTTVLLRHQVRSPRSWSAGRSWQRTRPGTRPAAAALPPRAGHDQRVVDGDPGDQAHDGRRRSGAARARARARCRPTARNAASSIATAASGSSLAQYTAGASTATTGQRAAMPAALGLGHLRRGRRR